MPTQLTGLRPPPYFPTSLTPLIDLGGGSYLLGILYGTAQPNVVNAVGVCCIVDKDWHATEIGASDPTRKDAGVAIAQEGRDALLIVSEASVPGGGGNTTGTFVYRFPDALPEPLGDPLARARASAALRWIRGVMGLEKV